MDEPIRVAQVIGKLMAGGVESVVYNYYRHIDHQKVQFDIFYDADSTVEPPQDLIDMGARFYCIPPYQNLPAFLRTLTMHFKQHQYTIVHSHLNTLNVFPLYAAKLAGVSVRISHNHSTAGKGERKNILKYMLRPFAKMFPTHYCACSAYAGKWLFGKAFYNSGKVCLIRNAIDLKKFTFNLNIRDQVRLELGLTDNFVLGHVGRFCYQKNHEFLIDIFHQVYLQESKARLLLIGDGELKEQVMEQVSALGLNQAVLFLGVRSDVDKLMQAMDVFVLPSRYEGLGIVAIEAQAASLPCVVSTKVPREAQILNSVAFIDLAQPVGQWTEAILDCKSIQRGDTFSQLQQAGFEIAKEAERLSEYYRGLV